MNDMRGHAPLPQYRFSERSEKRKVQGMKVRDIIRNSQLVTDDTRVILRFWYGDNVSSIGGKRSQSNILAHEEYDVVSFTWQDDKKVFIDIDKDESLLGL